MTGVKTMMSLAPAIPGLQGQRNSLRRKPQNLPPIDQET